MNNGEIAGRIDWRMVGSPGNYDKHEVAHDRWYPISTGRNYQKIFPQFFPGLGVEDIFNCVGGQQFRIYRMKLSLQNTLAVPVMAPLPTPPQSLSSN